MNLYKFCLTTLRHYLINLKLYGQGASAVAPKCGSYLTLQLHGVVATASTKDSPVTCVGVHLNKFDGLVLTAAGFRPGWQILHLEARMCR